ncbi:uncharacterized protein MELLADRAFT_96021 [Melampsora larici-populina 98AG31]|uniref:Uncharacterized protein n=1 Tax=Melampsora larici-populina (strain 98AG31 / pathotype 3-4-7) TaxID=747676 RepID=F4SAM0_MELLP|nr:uncharacterized protein MELLADRAFT_96021 [Melampsora larici-populina 98AG31]EGF98312.1 hypothetical protein MELLADRAFT_96021 [Melampsora larici-populina 98AG31]
MVARWEADSARDLMYEESPYTPGQPKFGHDFRTGQPVEPPKPKDDWSWKGKGYGGDNSRGWGQKRQRGGNRGRGPSLAEIPNVPYVPQPFAPSYATGPWIQASPSNFSGHSNYAGPLNHVAQPNFTGSSTQGWLAQGQQHVNKQAGASYRSGRNQGKGKKNGKETIGKHGLNGKAGGYGVIYLRLTSPSTPCAPTSNFPLSHPFPLREIPLWLTFIPTMPTGVRGYYLDAAPHVRSLGENSRDVPIALKQDATRSLSAHNNVEAEPLTKRAALRPLPVPIELDTEHGSEDMLDKASEEDSPDSLSEEEVTGRK